MNSAILICRTFKMEKYCKQSQKQRKCKECKLKTKNSTTTKKVTSTWQPPQSSSVEPWTLSPPQCPLHSCHRPKTFPCHLWLDSGLVWKIKLRYPVDPSWLLQALQATPGYIEHLDGCFYTKTFDRSFGKVFWCSKESNGSSVLIVSSVVSIPSCKHSLHLFPQSQLRWPERYLPKQ